jgi:hypothetical protein
MRANEEAVEYVVTALGEGRATPLPAALAAHEGVTVLDAIDDTTVLVRADPAVIDRVARGHPNLVIEPNIPYSKADRPR